MIARAEKHKHTPIAPEAQYDIIIAGP